VKAFNAAWELWKKFGHFAAEWFSRALFALLYLLLFAPVALIARLAGKRFLPHFDANCESFFLPKEKIPPRIERLRKQW
jgi:hypothetical protein